MNSWQVSTVEALRLGAEALRADVESAEVAGPLADPDGAARDSAAARALEALANAGANPESILAVAEGLRLVADAFMGDARFDELVRIESTFRRLTGCAASPIAEPEALAADADALRADAESSLRRLEATADDRDGDDFPEDRVSRLGAAASVPDFADSIRDAVEGERLRIAAAACGILAARIAADWSSFTPDERIELAEAIRADWTTPDR